MVEKAKIEPVKIRIHEGRLAFFRGHTAAYRTDRDGTEDRGTAAKPKKPKAAAEGEAPSRQRTSAIRKARPEKRNPFSPKRSRPCGSPPPGPAGSPAKAATKRPVDFVGDSERRTPGAARG